MSSFLNRAGQVLGILALCILATNLGFTSNDDATNESQAVQDDVRKFITASYNSDVDTVISFTYPRVLNLMGGEAKAREALETAFKRFEALGMELESISFPNSPDFINGETNEYVVVPTNSIISVNGQRARSMNFQFGIRPRGIQEWKYVEGSRMSKEMLAALFPDFPAEYKFPAVSRERI